VSSIVRPNPVGYGTIANFHSDRDQFNLKDVKLVPVYALMHPHQELYKPQTVTYQSDTLCQDLVFHDWEGK
jgi:hypothetical protein